MITENLQLATTDLGYKKATAKYTRTLPVCVELVFYYFKALKGMLSSSVREKQMDLCKLEQED